MRCRGCSMDCWTSADWSPAQSSSSSRTSTLRRCSTSCAVTSPTSPPTRACGYRSISPRAHVHSDATLVGQVLRNLLSNAIKYTQQGSVELRCETRGGKGAYRSSRHRGRHRARPGRADLRRVLPDRSFAPQLAHGYGLGLSIVQRIARLLRFEVEVSSQPGHGSVFAIELPAAVAPASAATRRAPSAIQSAGAASRHVLLVEDEPGVRNAMRTLLNVEGYRVITAAGAEEALGHLRNGHSICWSPTITWKAVAPGRRSSRRPASASAPVSGPSSSPAIPRRRCARCRGMRICASPASRSMQTNCSRRSAHCSRRESCERGDTPLLRSAGVDQHHVARGAFDQPAGESFGPRSQARAMTSPRLAPTGRTAARRSMAAVSSRARP